MVNEQKEFQTPNVTLCGERSESERTLGWASWANAFLSVTDYQSQGDFYHPQ